MSERPVGAGPRKGEEARGGAASVDITPPVGVELAGWSFGPSVGVHDRLFAKVLVLDNGPSPYVIMTADLIGLGTAYASELRARIAAELRTKVERVMISCSHTHSGPGTMPLRRWGAVDEEYVSRTLDAMASVALEAARRLEPVRIGVGETHVRGICDNRRGDRGNVVDESLPVVRVDREDGRPIAVLMNYSCHPVAAHGDRNLISADYPGFAMRHVQSFFAAAAPHAMFTLGAAGDVNPVKFHNLALAEQYGAEIGEAAVAAAQQIETRSVSPLAAVSRTIALPVRKPPAASWLRDEAQRWSAEASRLSEAGGEHSKIEDAFIKAEWAAEALGVVERDEWADRLEMEMQAIRIGETVLVAIPGELFVEIGMQIKRASAYEHTIIVELANGSLCYLPTADAFRRGGYETDFAAKVYGLHMLTDRAQEIVERAAAELLRELRDADRVDEM